MGEHARTAGRTIIAALAIGVLMAIVLLGLAWFVSAMAGYPYLG